MAALDSLTATIRGLVTWTATDSLTGTDYGATSNNSTITKSITLGTSAGNAVALGADQLVSYLLTISASSSTTIDLTSLTNIIGSAAVFARLKAVMFRLLSATDDATNGTAAASVTIGNAAATVNTLFLDDDTYTFTVKTGEFILWGTPSAAGITVDSSNKSVKILNNSSTLSAVVQITLIGGTS